MILEALVSWFAARLPVLAQVVGALAVAYGVGVAFGYAYGAIAFGVEALAGGTLAELDAKRKA